MQGCYGNCRAEAAALTEELIGLCEGRAVRFIEVIQQNEDDNEVDRESCQYWADTNNLANHVYMARIAIRRVCFSRPACLTHSVHCPSSKSSTLTR